jgi:putative PIN family toxin of toxin-antitoxin system
MRIVLDTNVLYQAVRDQGGASFYILQLVRQQQIELALSVPVFLEYREVLLRPEKLEDIGRSSLEVEAVFRFVAYIAKPISIYFLMRPHLSDERDNKFVELAFASNSLFLVTSNTTHFTQNTELKFDSFEVVTPSQFVQTWRKKHGKQKK